MHCHSNLHIHFNVPLLDGFNSYRNILMPEYMNALSISSCHSNEILPNMNLLQLWQFFQQTPKLLLSHLTNVVIRQTVYTRSYITNEALSCNLSAYQVCQGRYHIAGNFRMVQTFVDRPAAAKIRTAKIW